MVIKGVKARVLKTKERKKELKIEKEEAWRKPSFFCNFSLIPCVYKVRNSSKVII
jgi:hypothetical protein